MDLFLVDYQKCTFPQIFTRSFFEHSSNYLENFENYIFATKLLLEHCASSNSKSNWDSYGMILGHFTMQQSFFFFLNIPGTEFEPERSLDKVHLAPHKKFAWGSPFY